MHRARGYSCHTCHQCALRASRHRAFSHRAFSHRAFSQQQCHQSVCCWGGSSQGLAQPDYTVAPAAAAVSSTTAPPGAPSTPLPCGSAPHHQQTTPTLQLGAPPHAHLEGPQEGCECPHVHSMAGDSQQVVHDAGDLTEHHTDVLRTCWDLQDRRMAAQKHAQHKNGKLCLPMSAWGADIKLQQVQDGLWTRNSGSVWSLKHSTRWLDLLQATLHCDRTRMQYQVKCM